MEGKVEGKPSSLWLSIRYISCDTIQLRSHYGIPSHEDGGQNLPKDLNHRVYLCHPGYSGTGNILMEGFLTETRTGKRARDISCRITNHIEGTEHAHLNTILFRSDVHTIFDQKRFAIILKSSILLVHILAPGSSLQLTRLYHNVLLQPLLSVAIQYVLPRFAWTIFAQSVDFMQQGLKRRLCIYLGEGETSIADFSGDQCRQQLSLGFISRSRSPRKRQRDAFVAPAGHGEDNREDNREEEYLRGRRRRRSLWATSQDTISDTDIDDNNNELDNCNDTERHSKRRYLSSLCNQINYN
ncbi:hypothetical protein V2W45_1473570 [Cenococcum geophilum]